MTIKISSAVKAFVEVALNSGYEFGQEIEKRVIDDLVKTHGIKYPSYMVLKAHGARSPRRGWFELPTREEFGAGATTVTTREQEHHQTPTTTEMKLRSAEITVPQTDLIPAKNSSYVAWGNHGDLKQILSSQIFYPVFISGLSGNGKTFMAEQVCAQLKREMVRVNFTVETDEIDLIGGFRLINGNTVWQDGPVLEAMKRGAVLLLDEIDLACDKVMCLQSILEGSGYFVKKTNTFISPKPGFTIIATANTSGRGDETDKFVGTHVMNEAFLERFCVVINQPYPSRSVERNILKAHCLESDDIEITIDNLCRWAEMIRASYYDNLCNDVITTRRLVQILKTYAIFGDIQKSITMGIQRFGDVVSASWMDLYNIIDKKEENTPTPEEAGIALASDIDTSSALAQSI